MENNTSKLLFLDVETTGLEDEDRLCQVAYAFEAGEGACEEFKPPLPIKVGAMAISHITNKMVEDKPIFEGSQMQKDLRMFAEQDYILVAHNAPFDLAMLAKDGVVFKDFIDTKKMSHRLDPDDSMESHRMQYLRYYYDLELPNAVAHTADGDVAVLRAVYEALFERMDETVPDLVTISKLPVLFSKFSFGKYKGNLIGEIALINPGYLEHMIREKKKNSQDEEDWIYTLEHYLKNV